MKNWTIITKNGSLGSFKFRESAEAVTTMQAAIAAQPGNERPYWTRG